QAHPLGDVNGPFHGQALNLEAIVLNLNEIAIAKNSLKPGCDFAGGVNFQLWIGTAQQGPAELARDTTAEANNPLVVFGQQLAIDAWLAIKAFQESLRSELNQILKALSVFGQEREMIASLLQRFDIFLEAAAGSDVGLIAQNRVNPLFLGFAVELQRAV